MLQAEALVRAKRYDEALALLGKEKESPAVDRPAGRGALQGRPGGRGRAACSPDLAAGDEQSALAAAQSYQRLEKYQESIPVLEKLAAAHPDQAATGFMLGAAYERSGQRDKAVDGVPARAQARSRLSRRAELPRLHLRRGGHQSRRGPEAGEPGGGARSRQRRLRRLTGLDLLSDSAAPSRPAAIWSGPPAWSPRTRRCKSTWGMSMLRWGRRSGQGRPTSGRSISEATADKSRRQGAAQAGRPRQGGAPLSPVRGPPVRGLLLACCCWPRAARAARAPKPLTAARPRSPGRSRRRPTARSGSTG